MSVPDSSEFHRVLHGSWEALGEGAPLLSAFAGICAQVLIAPPQEPQSLSIEALAILYAARNRGVIEVRGVRTAFEAPARLLAVYVEIDDQRTIAFRSQEQPEVTVRFLDGFAQLCRNGCILHHQHRDFSLSRTGFSLAREIQLPSVADALAEATEFGLHE